MMWKLLLLIQLIALIQPAMYSPEGPAFAGPPDELPCEDIFSGRAVTTIEWDQTATHILSKFASSSSFQASLLTHPQAFLSSKGMDPNFVTFTFSQDYGGEFPAHLFVNYRGERALQLTFKQKSGHRVDDVCPHTERLSQTPTGLGSVTYLKAARQLYKDHQMQLASDLFVESSSFGVSKEAREMWTRFQKMGLAEKLWTMDRDYSNEVYYRFKKEVLISDLLQMFDEL
jgi:hypothetical protein